MWELSSGKPLPDSPVQVSFFGAPPWHFQCRSTLLPILMSLDDMLANAGQLPDETTRALDALPPSTRASLDGQVAQDLDYESWLKTQPRMVQRSVLGPSLFNEWKGGGVKLHRIDVERQAPAISMGRFRNKTFGRKRGQRLRDEAREAAA